MKKNTTKEEITIIDRIAVAFLSGILAFITGFIIWFLLVIAFEFEGKYVFSSLKLVVGFAGVMSVAGFFKLENFLANLFGHLWHGIYNHIRH